MAEFMSKKLVAGYILDKKIGSGSYATVWRGRVEGKDEQVAVKVISRQRLTETAQLRREVEVLRRVKHANIVRFKDLKKSAAHFYLVLEYCAGGDLSQFLKERGRVDEENARRFLTQIAAGLCVLHRENVLHRDLKPQNILLSDSSNDPVLKIADFGFARALKPQDMAATVCGSPLYMAPEILRYEPYDAKADLWSVGAILYEVLLGRPPFTGSNPLQLLANIEKVDGVSFEGVQVSVEGQAFLMSLLMRSPAERLTRLEFFKHPYVRLGPVTELPDAMSQSTQVPGEWCVPAGDPGAREQQEAGPHSGASSPNVASPACSPRGHSDDGRQAQDEVAFELRCEALPSAVHAEATEGEARCNSPLPQEAESWMSPAPTAPSIASCTSAGGSPAARTHAAVQGPQELGDARRTRMRGEEEEFVVVAQQPLSSWARSRGASPRARTTNSFCGNLSRLAHALEQLALQLQEESPPEALALFVRSLSLVEKALTVSYVEEETAELLRRAYARIFGTSEACARQVRSSSALPPPVRTNTAIFDFAIQQAEEASAEFSKCLKVGGLEVGCREKLNIALLLLDLLGSEADGEDLTTIQACTAPITQFMGKLDRLRRPSIGTSTYC